MLFTAVRGRSAQAAARAARLLVGVGPGSTPLGDDCLAACALTVSTVGQRAGMTAGEATLLGAALLPPEAEMLTTPVSARMFAAVRRKEVPQEVAAALRIGVGERELARLVGAVCGIGASSGSA